MKIKFTKKEELDAEIRDKLTMPLAILNQFMIGKKISKDKIQLAIDSLNEVLEALDK